MRRRAIRPARQLAKYSGVKYFTETFSAGNLPVSGGWFTCALASMVNHNQYFGLFDLGYITRFDVMLVPNGGDTVLGTSPATGRITIASTQNFDSTLVIPNELNILGEDNSRIIPLDGKRTIKFTMWNPKPDIGPLGEVEAGRNFNWLNLNLTSQQNRLFGGIKYWISGAISAEQYSVYVRVYAMFKEQQ